MPNIDAILSDFLRLKSACEEMSSKKIVVGIVGEVDSEVLKVAQIHEYGTEKMPERSFLLSLCPAPEYSRSSSPMRSPG